MRTGCFVHDIVAVVGVTLVAIFFCTVSASSCINPAVASNVYTTLDASVATSTAFVTEFSLRCSNGAKDLPLYALMNNHITPISKSVDGDKYQFSWVGEHSEAPAGTYVVRVFDSEGYQALKKAQRNEDDISAIKPVFTFDIQHPGPYHGPWLQSEFIAVLIAILIWWMAYNAKSKLQG